MTDQAMVRRQLRRLRPLTLAGFKQPFNWYINSAGMPVVIAPPPLASAPLDIIISADDSLVILTARPCIAREEHAVDARDVRYAQALNGVQDAAPLRVDRCVLEKLSEDSIARETLDYNALELVNPFAGAVETRMVEHMNDDHVDALRAYCGLLGIALDEQSPSMIGIDADGFDMLLEGSLVRVEFGQPCVTPQDARKGLVELAERGRSAARTDHA